MLHVVIPSRKEQEFWDEQQEVFITIPPAKEQKLQLEHSLVSISKWESKWHKPFLSTKMTDEQSIDYIRCMTITQNVPPEVYDRIPSEIIDEITEYINNPMTATWFSEDKNQRPNREVVTNELIYYWMIALDIPAAYEKWHLNRLLTLIKVCKIKNEPPKKMGKNTTLRRNASLNAARLRQYNTKG